MSASLLREQIEDLMALASSPGWKYLTARIKGQCDAQMQTMRNAKSQEELLKATYTYLALHDLPEAPEMLIRVLTQQLPPTKK
jgi:hypothetical protein